MIETFNYIPENEKGPSGPIFYLVENKGKKDTSVKLAQYLVEELNNPNISIIVSPVGVEHSDYQIHELAIDFAKNGQKELVVEEHEILMNRYANAASVIRRGGALIKFDNYQDPEIVYLLAQFDALFPQNIYS